MFYLTPNAVIAFILFTLSVWLFASRKKAPPLPPGPPKRLFVGNLFDLPSTYDWKTYGEWGDKYGALAFLQTEVCLLMFLYFQVRLFQHLRSASPLLSSTRTRKP